MAQADGVAGDVAGFLGRLDHLRDQHMSSNQASSSVLNRSTMPASCCGLAQGAACGVSLNLDLAAGSADRAAW